MDNQSKQAWHCNFNQIIRENIHLSICNKLLLLAGNYLQALKLLQTSWLQEYIVRVEIFTFNNLSGGDFYAAA
ncbi:hypothetical protein SpAn4DRAFT_2206 [Sporomusa ovata]|uniref:Uncharacterized protein n=1 Tax=Sporomusa ovata TaxID=2378 RepID=A0A0U1L238_9FIRM|nr:hypothetical protein [Sporomusa ovata]CQR72974.1 hypothetical protein SpAn4DRAFT_2206 [Sporomusa ovata]